MYIYTFMYPVLFHQLFFTSAGLLTKKKKKTEEYPHFHQCGVHMFDVVF